MKLKHLKKILVAKGIIHWQKEMITIHLQHRYLFASILHAQTSTKRLAI